MIIIKRLSQSGYCSRREAERLVRAGQVCIDGKVVDHPAFDVPDEVAGNITINGQPLPATEAAKLWRFHKPRGCLTTHYDPEGRATIYDYLPPEFATRHAVGRLDYNSEGLLLLTNNGELKRQLELPSSALKRSYRVRLQGCPAPKTINAIKAGVTIEGIHYRPAGVVMEKVGSNSWLEMTLTEGKNREIRRIFEHFGHPVSRLIRIRYGQWELGSLPVEAHERCAETGTFGED